MGNKLVMVFLALAAYGNVQVEGQNSCCDALIEIISRCKDPNICQDIQNILTCNCDFSECLEKVRKMACDCKTIYTCPAWLSFFSFDSDSCNKNPNTPCTADQCTQIATSSACQEVEYCLFANSYNCNPKSCRFCNATMCNNVLNMFSTNDFDSRCKILQGSMTECDVATCIRNDSRSCYDCPAYDVCVDDYCKECGIEECLKIFQGSTTCDSQTCQRMKDVGCNPKNCPICADDLGCRDCVAAGTPTDACQQKFQCVCPPLTCTVESCRGCTCG